MRIIVPMAGRGTRLRPHTFTTPKPLLPVAGKSIVQRLVEDIAAIYDGPIQEVVFIIARDFGEPIEQELVGIAHQLGAEGRITYQDQPLGTAHAIQCAGDSLKDEIIIAFADTLFKADFSLAQAQSGVIWVKRVADPSSFGVVTVNDQGVINGMVEKPETPVSDLAIIGIYYVKDGTTLKEEIDAIISQDIKSKGEYQLTDALQRMTDQGAQFLPGKVDDWMDCGNKANLLGANHATLDYEKDQQLVSDKATIQDTIIHSPCYIADGAQIHNSVVGPYVSVGANAYIADSVIRSSIVREEAQLQHANIADSILGQKSQVRRAAQELNLGDYSAG
jgi:glucose-1-phosphate thymidylyltransferase